MLINLVFMVFKNEKSFKNSKLLFDTIMTDNEHYKLV